MPLRARMSDIYMGINTTRDYALMYKTDTKNEAKK